MLPCWRIVVYEVKFGWKGFPFQTTNGTTKLHILLTFYLKYLTVCEQLIYARVKQVREHSPVNFEASYKQTNNRRITMLHLNRTCP